MNAAVERVNGHEIEPTAAAFEEYRCRRCGEQRAGRLAFEQFGCSGGDR